MEDSTKCSQSGCNEAANTACLVAALARELLLQEGHTDNDDVVSLHASDDNLSDAPRDTFTNFKEKFSNKVLTGQPLLVQLNVLTWCTKKTLVPMTTPLLFSKRNSALRT